MSKIYRTSDRIPLKIDDVVLTIGPLTQSQKLEVQSLMLKGRASGDIETATKGIIQAIRYAVKDINGVKDSQNNDYKLSKETVNGSDILTQECAEELLNLEISGKLVLVCSTLSGGFTTTFTDEKGLPLVGVEVVESGDSTKKS